MFSTKKLSEERIFRAPDLLARYVDPLPRFGEVVHRISERGQT